MNVCRLALVACSALSLAACGGGGGGSGGGGVISTPTPAPAPAKIREPGSRSFDAAAALSGTTTVDATTGLVAATSQAQGPLSITYDSAAKSYSVSAGGRTTTFASTDLVDRQFTKVYTYEKEDGAQKESLSLYVGNPNLVQYTDYVALGLWLSSLSGGATNEYDYKFFSYGFPTAASERRTTGSGQYSTGIYGIFAQVGKSPYRFEIDGTTYFDFERGVFTIETRYSNAYYLDGTGGIIGSPYFLASGQIASSGNLEGTFFYDATFAPMSGLLTGMFYGPNANEAGGTFGGVNANGDSIKGGFVSLFEGSPGKNLTLVDQVFDEHFPVPKATFFAQKNHTPGVAGFGEGSIEHSGIFVGADGLYRVGGTTVQAGEFTDADLVENGRPDFVTYAKTYSDNTPDDTEVSLYVYDGKVSGVELTYTNFAEYRRIQDAGSVDGIFREFMPYGVETPEGVLSRRTGSATYDGIVLGAATDAIGEHQFDVSGQSHFLVQFGAMNVTGWLDLIGTDWADQAETDFGRFDFEQNTPYGRNAILGVLNQGGSQVGDVQLRFYGPNAEEIGGAFDITNAGGYTITGATIGKRN